MKCFGLCVEKNVMACLHTMSECEGLYGQWLSSRLLFDLFYLQQRENETKLKKNWMRSMNTLCTSGNFILVFFLSLAVKNTSNFYVNTILDGMRRRNR